MYNTKCYYPILMLLSICYCSLLFANDMDSRGLSRINITSDASESFTLGKFRAIIIGNNHYQDGNGVWANLKTAIKDAEKVASLLEIEYDFSDITLLKNAGRKEILGEFKKLSSRVEANDNILIYYAGHGYLDKEERRGYWIPTDGLGYDDTTFIRNSTIRDEINIISEKSKHTLLISDSCFSGSLLRGGNRGPSSMELSQGYYFKVANKKSVQVLTSGSNEYVDDNYRDSGHSPFTYFLVNELKNNKQKYVSLSELATNIIKAVANNSEQTPLYGVLANAGDELGEFIFVRSALNDNFADVVTVKNIALETNELEIQPAPTLKESHALLPAFRF